jgi:hypothetical protein
MKTAFWREPSGPYLNEKKILRQLDSALGRFKCSRQFPNLQTRKDFQDS